MSALLAREAPPEDRLAALPDDLLVRLPFYMREPRDAVALARTSARARETLAVIVRAASASVYRWCADPRGADGVVSRNGAAFSARLARSYEHSNCDRTITLAGGPRLVHAPVLASPRARAGRQRWRVRVDRSATGDGEDVRFGVISDDEGKAWSLDAYHGRFFAHDRNCSVRTQILGPAVPAHATLKGRATGSVVEVIVEDRRLSFRVNESEPFAVPDLELPALVRPWAQLCLPTAQLSIFGHATPWLDQASLDAVFS